MDRMQQLSAIQKASLGSMLGAFIGDSLGSYLEFNFGNITNDMINTAMSMPGGGHFQLQPGQVTDDSELAMCQMRGLIAGEGKFDLFHLCLYYGHWVRLEPFDIGQTTAKGLGAQL